MTKREVVVLCITLAVLALLGAAALAQQQAPAPGPPMPGGAGMPGGMGMMQQGMGMMGMCPMHAAMMDGMMGPPSVAVLDGAVYVLAGNQLMKYDQNLDLANEVEVAVDTDQMNSWGQAMMEKCPMMQGGGGAGPGMMRQGPGMMGQGAGMTGQGMGMGLQMMRSWMRPTLFANDGAVYVLVGNQLMKYDRNLKLQKSTEIKVDWGKMGQIMKDMAGKCPMCRPMMQGKMGKEGGAR